MKTSILQSKTFIPNHLKYVHLAKEGRAEITEEGMINRATDEEIIKRFNTPCYCSQSFQERLKTQLSGIGSN